MKPAALQTQPGPGEHLREHFERPCREWKHRSVAHNVSGVMSLGMVGPGELESPTSTVSR
jgi:hypothetical protein